MAGKIGILVLGVASWAAGAQTPPLAAANPGVESIAIDSTPEGLAFTADNVAYQTPATFQWLAESQHTVAFAAIVNGATGVRYQFRNWADSTDPYVRTISVGGSSASYVAAFTTEYFVTLAASPANGGSVTGGGWCNAGSTGAIRATAQSGFSFTGFSGDLTGSTNPSTVTVSKPLHIVANFAPGGVAALFAALTPVRQHVPAVPADRRQAPGPQHSAAGAYPMAHGRGSRGIRRPVGGFESLALPAGVGRGVPIES